MGADMVKTKTVPKYKMAQEWIRERINSGSWPPGYRIPDQAELTRKLKVSEITIKRALSELAQEGLIVRRKKSGTFVSVPGRQPLIKGRNLHIGILLYHSVTEELSQPGFDSDIIQGIIAYLGIENKEPAYSLSKRQGVSLALWQQRENGVRAQCMGTYPGIPGRHPNLNAAKKAGFDGLCAIGILENDFLDEVLGLGIPTTIIDYPSQVYKDRCDMVYADPDHGYQKVIESFLEKGIRNIHFIGTRMANPNAIQWTKDGYKKVWGRRTNPDSLLRLNACRHALDAFGLELPERRVHFISYDIPHHQALFEEFAALPADERPEAVFCQDASTAEWFVEAFGKRGMHLEGAGGCSGFHYGRSIGIQVDACQMGQTAAELLIERLKKPERPFANVGIHMKAYEHQLAHQQKMRLVPH